MYGMGTYLSKTMIICWMNLILQLNQWYNKMKINEYVLVKLPFLFYTSWSPGLTCKFWSGWDFPEASPLKNEILWNSMLSNKNLFHYKKRICSNNFSEKITVYLVCRCKTWEKTAPTRADRQIETFFLHTIFNRLSIGITNYCLYRHIQ